MNSSVDKDGTVTIGKVVGVHGLKGTCKIYLYADCLEVFESGREIFIRNTAGEALDAFEVDWCKPHNRLILVSLRGVNDRSRAENLVGKDIVAQRSSLPEPDSGTYYWHDLIGMAVYSTEGLFLGHLESVIPTGSNDVYVVKRTDAGPNDEILIPALTSVVVDIDLEKQIMRVDLPEGL